MNGDVTMFKESINTKIVEEPDEMSELDSLIQDTCFSDGDQVLFDTYTTVPNPSNDDTITKSVANHALISNRFGQNLKYNINQYSQSKQIQLIGQKFKKNLTYSEMKRAYKPQKVFKAFKIDKTSKNPIFTANPKDSSL